MLTAMGWCVQWPSGCMWLACAGVGGQHPWLAWPPWLVQPIWQVPFGSSGTQGESPNGATCGHCHRCVSPMARVRARGRWGAAGRAVPMACVATMVGAAKVAGAPWLQWPPVGGPWCCCLCSLPCGACPMGGGRLWPQGGQGGGTAPLPCASTMDAMGQVRGTGWLY